MKKLIFLDIDDVLNNDAWMIGPRWEHLKEIAGPSSGPYSSVLDLHSLWANNPYHDFCPENVRHFNRILNKTGASIVVSSTWRKGKTPQELEEILLQNGGVDCLGKVIGKTDDIHPERRLSTDVPRRRYINKWIIENPGPWHFLVIDDDPNAWVKGSENFLHIPHLNGLTSEEADRAIAFLNSID